MELGKFILILIPTITICKIVDNIVNYYLLKKKIYLNAGASNVPKITKKEIDPRNNIGKYISKNIDDDFKDVV